MPSSYAIGAHFEDMIKGKVASGRYASASEVIREALRLFEEREKVRTIQLEKLKKEVQQGVESGAGIPADTLFPHLEEKYKKACSIEGKQ